MTVLCPAIRGGASCATRGRDTSRHLNPASPAYAQKRGEKCAEIMTMTLRHAHYVPVAVG